MGMSSKKKCCSVFKEIKAVALPCPGLSQATVQITQYADGPGFFHSFWYFPVCRKRLYFRYKTLYRSRECLFSAMDNGLIPCQSKLLRMTDKKGGDDRL